MYPIGTPGKPWGEAEKKQWLAMQSIKRSYAEEVVSQLEGMPDYFSVIQYGALPYDEARYPLFALVPRQPKDNLPWVLITGGVHGYETSGVQGALLFAREFSQIYTDKVNIIIVPCVSPWGYETINRWDPLALDPNRSFYKASPAPEARMLMDFIGAMPQQFFLHIDLHETTDTDNSEFRPALAARDAIEQKAWDIPDGFYLVADEAAPHLPLQQAIINEVKKYTHIAPTDENGLIIGSEVPSEGVICYDKRKLFLCGGFNHPQYCSTTEVYPDSPSATPDICNRAQVAAVEGALQFLLG